MTPSDIARSLTPAQRRMLCGGRLRCVRHDNGEQRAMEKLNAMKLLGTPLGLAVRAVLEGEKEMMK